VIEEPIPGIPRAASAGYDAASGDIIARLDADSLPSPHWLERIELRFRARPDADFVTGDARFYGSTPFIHWVGRNLYIGAMYAVITPLLSHPPLFGSNMAMRTPAWRALSARSAASTTISTSPSTSAPRWACCAIGASKSPYRPVRSRTGARSADASAG
jgi:glycosyltransferase involved in cell wall biosynthesis